MYKQILKNVVRAIILTAVLIVAMMYAGCNYTENPPETTGTSPTLAVTEQEIGENGATADKVATYSENVTDASSQSVTEEEEFQWPEVDETADSAEMSEGTFGYGNGIELPDHNWD